MYKICKTKQSADRQRYISDVLFKMLLRHSIDEISISSLCQKAKFLAKHFIAILIRWKMLYSTALTNGKKTTPNSRQSVDLPHLNL